MSDAASGAESLPALDSYNPIYERLVDDPVDDHEIVGLIAYALYKRAKREWAARIRSRHGRGPSSTELSDYVETWTPSRLSSLRAEAASALAGYANYVIVSEEPRILKDALRGTFWPSILRSMVAAAIYTLALIALAIIAARAGVDLLGILRSAAQS
ncbi:MAG TPA: hypothetical protein VLQ65_02045 [Saliniramus sp.]|nr:hypothetical protein [Saliniramus sp.]